MAKFLVKCGARGLAGFGEFVACEEFAGDWVAAMNEAMNREWAAVEAGERVNGRKVLFEVMDAPLANQAEYDAFMAARAALPVVNVLD